MGTDFPVVNLSRHSTGHTLRRAGFSVGLGPLPVSLIQQPVEMILAHKHQPAQANDCS